MRLPRSPISLALAAAVALAPLPGGGVASAQPASNEAEATYKQHMSNGVKLFQDKNYEAAITEFEAAYKAKPKASPLVNIALCQKAQFRYPKAIATLETALGKHGDTLSGADRKAAEDAIAELKALLGFVTVKLVPPDAKLTVDGEEQPKGAAAKPIPLGPGSHKLSAAAEGYAETEKQVTVTSGEKDKVVDLTLTPDKEYVTLSAKDAKTAIAVDQKAVGYGKWTGFLSPGTHYVQMYTPGGGRGFETQVVVAAGKAQQVNEGEGGMAIGFGADEPKKEPPPPPRSGWYGLAAATLFGTPTSINNFTAPDAGIGIGARIGYRPATVVGLEGMFEYRSTGAKGFASSYNPTSTKTESADAAHVSFTSSRVGGNLRIMTRGRVARFVAVAGAGVAFDSVSWKDCKGSDNRTFCKDMAGPDLYVVVETGFELEFSNVFFGLTLQQMGSSFGSLETSDGTPSIDEVPLQIGLGLRLGYGRW